MQPPQPRTTLGTHRKVSFWYSSRWKSAAAALRLGASRFWSADSSAIMAAKTATIQRRRQTPKGCTKPGALGAPGAAAPAVAGGGGGGGRAGAPLLLPAVGRGARAHRGASAAPRRGRRAPRSGGCEKAGAVCPPRRRQRGPHACRRRGGCARRPRAPPHALARVDARAARRHTLPPEAPRAHPPRAPHLPQGSPWRGRRAGAGGARGAGATVRVCRRGAGPGRDRGPSPRGALSPAGPQQETARGTPVIPGAPRRRVRRRVATPVLAGRVRGWGGLRLRRADV
jgi:hypothetical protein